MSASLIYAITVAFAVLVAGCSAVPGTEALADDGTPRGLDLHRGVADPRR